MLLDLPSELLAAIFAWIGPEFFKSDLRLLLVCKRWYHFAIGELLKEVELSPEKLHRLLSKRKERSLNHLGNHVKSMSFKTGGFYTLEAKRGDDEEKKLGPLKQWLRYLTDYHRDIPTILAKCTRLRGLTFRAEWYEFGLYTREDAANDDLYFCTLRTPGDDIQSATIRDIISHAHTHNITSLELDLRGSECVTSRNRSGSPDGRDSFLHLCPSIARLFSRQHLRSLSLGLRCVCPVLLRPTSGPSKIWLEEFLLHITPVVGQHSRICYGDGHEASPQSFEKLAKQMLPRMVHPKVVKVVSHSGPPLELIDIAYYLRVYDALAGTETNVECYPCDDRPHLSSLKYY